MEYYIILSDTKDGTQITGNTSGVLRKNTSKKDINFIVFGIGHGLQCGS